MFCKETVRASKENLLQREKIKTCFQKTSAEILDMKYGEGFFFRWNDGLEAFVYTSVVMFGSWMESKYWYYPQMYCQHDSFFLPVKKSNVVPHLHNHKLINQSLCSKAWKIFTPYYDIMQKLGRNLQSVNLSKYVQKPWRYSYFLICLVFFFQSKQYLP